MEVEWGRTSFREATAIFDVVIPFAADRLAIGHKNVMPLAHFAIEIFHPELLAVFGPGGELIALTEEVTVGANFEHDAHNGGDIFQ